MAQAPPNKLTTMRIVLSPHQMCQKATMLTGRAPKGEVEQMDLTQGLPPQRGSVIVV